MIVGNGQGAGASNVLSPINSPALNTSTRPTIVQPKISQPPSMGKYVFVIFVLIAIIIWKGKK